MKIGIFGYGKMGRMIEQVAIERNHEIVARVDLGSRDIDYSGMDVAIDFSTPDTAFGHITECLQHHIPVICGTTGWLDRYYDAVAVCNDHKGAFLYSSNFSLGVQLFFALNRSLAVMMKNFPQYRAGIHETHHTEKVDAPSGTAITLAEDLIRKSNYLSWQRDHYGDAIVAITSAREGNVPGTHVVDYASDVDTIEIKHTAHNRKGFALGALTAAEWIIGKKGIFTMQDVLNLG